MGRGQVTLFIVLGIILILIIATALYIASKNNDVSQLQNELKDKVSSNPALAAEVERMQERLNECLKLKMDEAVDDFLMEGTAVNNEGEIETVLTGMISDYFPSCAYKFNTINKITVIDDEMPRVNLVLTEEKLLAEVKFKLQGTFQDENYVLTDYLAETNSEKLFEHLQRSKRGVADLVSPDCSVNLYAREQEGVYTDIIMLENNDCIVYYYDYNHLKDKKPSISSLYFKNCCTG